MGKGDGQGGHSFLLTRFGQKITFGFMPKRARRAADDCIDHVLNRGKMRRPRVELRKALPGIKFPIGQKEDHLCLPGC
jgi:hypothetical protein